MPAAQEVVWANLINPDILAASFPGVKRWEPLSGTNQFLLHMSHQAFPQAQRIPPIKIQWHDQIPPQKLAITSKIPLDSTPFEILSTLTLKEEQPSLTTLTFAVEILTQSTVVEKLIRQFAPRTVDTFFKNFIRHL